MTGLGRPRKRGGRILVLMRKLRSAGAAGFGFGEALVFPGLAGMNALAAGFGPHALHAGGACAATFRAFDRALGTCFGVANGGSLVASPFGGGGRFGPGPLSCLLFGCRHNQNRSTPADEPMLRAVSNRFACGCGRFNQGT